MNKKSTLVSIVIIGSLWGMAEATVGYLAHIVSFFTFYGISGMIMSAIAVYFMRMAVKTTQKISSIFYVSLIAAAIKLFDLFLPFLPATKTINPAIAILAEGLSVAIAWKVFFSHKKALSSAMFTGIAWRVVYTFGIALFNIAFFGSFVLSAPVVTYILSFILLQGAINGLILYPVFKSEKVFELKGELASRPEFAIISLAIAVSLELLSRII